MFRAYERDCKAGEVKLGKVQVFDLGGLVGGPRWIINFPTKGHWRAGSRMADIETGLQDLVATIKRLHIRFIGVPPLGCGNGGQNQESCERGAEIVEQRGTGNRMGPGFNVFGFGGAGDRSGGAALGDFIIENRNPDSKLASGALAFAFVEQRRQFRESGEAAFEFAVLGFPDAALQLVVGGGNGGAAGVVKAREVGRAIEVQFAVSGRVASGMRGTAGAADEELAGLGGGVWRAEEFAGDGEADGEIGRAGGRFPCGGGGFGRARFGGPGRFDQRRQGNGGVLPKCLRVVADETEAFEVLARFVHGEAVELGDVLPHGSECRVVVLRGGARDEEEDFQAGVGWTPKRGGDAGPFGLSL